MQSNIIICLFSLTDTHDTYENRTSTLEKMTETVSVKGDTHINEEASFLYAPYLFSLTCIVACFVCFRTNRSNRAQYKQRNINYYYFEITSTILKRSSIIEQIIHCRIRFFSIETTCIFSFAPIWYDKVNVCIHWYGIITLTVSHIKTSLSLLCHLIQYLLDNVIYAYSTDFCRISIIY